METVVVAGITRFDLWKCQPPFFYFLILDYDGTVMKKLKK
jgi:hypothetical protein